MDVLIRNTPRLPGGPSTDRRRRLTALRTGAGRLRRRKTTSTPWCSGSDPGRTAASRGVHGPFPTRQEIVTSTLVWGVVTTGVLEISWARSPAQTCVTREQRPGARTANSHTEKAWTTPPVLSVRIRRPSGRFFIGGCRWIRTSGRTQDRGTQVVGVPQIAGVRPTLQAR